MSTRKIATALGTAVLLLGAPATYALAGETGEGKGRDKVKQCNDGVDNGDGDGLVDAADPDCESPNDNSEATEPAEEPGGAPALPAELQALIDQITAALAPEEEEPCEADCPPPPGEEEPPAEPGPDPAAELQAIVEEVVAGLPSGPPSGGEPPALPAELQAVVDAVLENLPSGPPSGPPAELQAILDQLPPPPA